VQPARAANPAPLATAGSAAVSCTGRAVSVRLGRPARPGGRALPPAAGRPGRGGATILIAGPGGWSPAGPAIAAEAGGGFKAVISAEFEDFLRYNLIKTGILPVCVDQETVTALQSAVESDPGILLTVDAARREVRARGRLVARFGAGGGAEHVARRLQMAQRLLGSAALAGDARVRLQRRLVAICDALKAPGADLARGAWRLDLFLADLALSCQAGRTSGTRRR